MLPSRSEFLDLGGHRYHVRRWGDPAAPLLILLHGWCDVSASFQFLVDAFHHPWQVVAPDWRGFGLSEWNQSHYWFADYLADLDLLLEHCSPDTPATIVAHSMGGMAASLYAGARPERVGRLAILEGLGLLTASPEETPGRVAQWLKQKRRVGGFRRYPDTAAFAARLCKDNPRLDAAKAEFLALHLSRDDGDGVTWAADPRHQWVNPVRIRMDEAMASWRAVTAPVLHVAGTDSPYMKEAFAADPGELERRLGCFANLSQAMIDDCGHNLHHDQPRRLARILEDFLR
ncbi:MAG: alpha/beta hydrolase [Proteobacteria bacterium]|nr:alpha/beta hydrolase [Pseudomonadota bacterium]HQR02621.1 alpha/beta hydrolase [Rhodocyclaceae bacterium]